MTRTRAHRRPVKGQAASHRVEVHFTRRYKAQQEVAIRVQRNGLTYELLRAKLHPTQRMTIIAQYRLKGQDNAKSK